ncbi:MAG TPA: hypothetical protein VGD78_18560 [Chthoniobacterales bacterium]
MNPLRIMGVAGWLGLTGVAAQASVVTLDWNKVPQGALTKSGSSYVEAVNVASGQVDVSVTPKGPVTVNRFGPDNLRTPAVTDTIFQGGLASNFSNLSTVARFRPATGSDPTITFGIKFVGYKAVRDVSFSLFDVDADGSRYVDQVTFQTAGASLTGGLDNVVSGRTVTGFTPSPNLGAGSGNANVGVKYASLPSEQIVFTYHSPIRGTTLQGIGVGNVSFTVVPEVNQLAVGLAACVLGALCLRQNRRGLRMEL